MPQPRCPRCRGYLYLDTDDRRACFTCLQCGRSFLPDRGHDAVASR